MYAVENGHDDTVQLLAADVSKADSEGASGGPGERNKD